MKVEQIYTGCLAHGAYYIESKGEAVVIDPLREVKPYLEKAEKDGAKIKYVLETHFHADFVSGHLDLSKQTGAPIVFGPTASPSFEAHVAKDGEELKVGDVTIRVIHTPGHTMESTCYLLIDENGKEHSIYTGDTLFIGDVGRPDLAQKVIADLTQDKLARHLFHSLRTKIMTLSDDIIVYPGHGAGSACGKKMSKETVSTIGEQKATNYALRADMTEDEFVHEVLDGLVAPPSYFPENVLMNIKGYESIDKVLEQGTRALNSREFEVVANESDALILDARKPENFAKGFIPNSINIGIDGSFAPWVGTLIPDIKQNILLVAEEDEVEEVVTRLARVGYDHTLGYLKGGFQAWEGEVDAIQCISAAELEAILKTQTIDLIDVRKKSEYDSEHAKAARNVPLDFINDNMAEFDKEEMQYLHCAGGYRSMIAASILKARGYDNIVNINGGFTAIAETGIEKTDYVCPSTLL
jgi:hydroxyacylglutathione hydrolase